MPYSYSCISKVSSIFLNIIYGCIVVVFIRRWCGRGLDCVLVGRFGLFCAGGWVGIRGGFGELCIWRWGCGLWGGGGGLCDASFLVV